ncbi:MAG: hypothetical protein JWL82_303 [Parcubacteria group bacterium]|nr:hypothetical protein [Parcubacteria group bacterium]
MGILFLPGAVAAPAHVEASTTPAPASPALDEPSPKKVATVREVATNSYLLKLTAYNAVPEQTDGDPSTTASGISSNPEVIAARSLDLKEALPFGTVVLITREGKDTPACNFSKVEHLIGYRVIADTMNARFTKRVDVEFDSTDRVTVAGRSINPGIALGVCSEVKVKVVGHIPLSRVPDTQAELAAIFAPREIAINK